MQKISSVAELKLAIQQLEVEQEVKELQLKEQLYITYESVRPVNVIRRVFKDIFSSKGLGEDLTGTTFGMASGFLIKKLFIGSSGNIFKKLIGSVLQYGLSNFVSRNSEVIRSVGHMIISNLFPKKNKSKEA
jgi:hypothetical protein